MRKILNLININKIDKLKSCFGFINIKNAQKILLSILLFVLIISIICKSFAFDIGTKDLVLHARCEVLLKYNGNPINVNFVSYEKDGQYYPAYCLNDSLPGVDLTTYSVNGGSKLQDVNVWRAIINGYPYKSLAELGAQNEQEAFTATREAVYTMLYNRDTASYSPMDSDSGRRTYQVYLNIVNAARSSSEVIQNNIETSVNRTSDEWKVDEKDSNYLSKTYMLSSNIKSGYYRIELEGDVPLDTKVTDMDNNVKSEFKVGSGFKVLVPIQSLDKSGSFKIKAVSNIETKPVVYGATNLVGTQDYALAGYMYEESISNITEEYLKNLTKLQIIKQEYGTNNRLAGVKFNLMDSEKRVLKENLETNENGEIILDNILPGKYFIGETETLAGFNLYTDLIEVDIDLNEECAVTINNSLKEVKELDKEFEKVEVVPSYTETVQNVEKVAEVKKINNVTEVTTETLTEVPEATPAKLPVTGY